ncbi:MAG: DUF1624 domain-containing protein [Chloroflexaceae bacterium]|nr:DUF1624 domain-containing protein [Chloroflexaceae bacterium]
MRSNPPKRDATLDTLRGIAILTMLAANLAASALREPHPFWFRFFGTWAAPLFIFLCGYLVMFTAERKHYGFSHYLQRGLLVLAIAALVDIGLWGLYPFVSVDVLYLIGLSLPAAYFFRCLPGFWQGLVIAGMFMVTPLLQSVLGYSSPPTEISLLPDGEVVGVSFGAILKHWLIDGWFPVFPWLGFSFLGAYFTKIRPFHTSFASRAHWLLSGGLFLAGTIVWASRPGPLLTRNGYSELFYPPTLGYCLVAIRLKFCCCFVS